MVKPYKNFSVFHTKKIFVITISFAKFTKKSLVNLRKEISIIEIKQKICRKSVITIKMEKQEFYLGKVPERNKERRD